ncbi:hypothetical protein H696_05819 [Fonticula alba]|uniref:WASH complex subunit strumpellin n=1 Tax=Fonticula alba TaxID=691883 RepID=A0A058Z0P3_FONAL|nr:hypothetical protein H696_05819 [Fonticula alba]KCV67711.1 hypothetical protein H696_05819 [Fonticula alba]|eukprot:XP_009497895.1 hypothetical protein H696_05819 [Fonticula alba]
MSGADSSSSNDAGRVILTLCSRGNAIIAELHRLADYIPPQFRFNPSTARQLAILFPDFTYLSTSELCEKRIQSDPELLERDASLRDSLFDIVQRFYLLFESIYKYSDDLVNVITDLQDGVFVHQSLETMMIDFKGRQLLVEALYLYGCMLLLIDQLIEGPIRERLLIAYHRYQSDQVAVSNMVSVCQLLQSTGYLPDPKAKRPDNYPEAFFARYRIPVDYVSFAIERLCLEDIYNTATLHYQRPEHRSAALSAQAAMMYVILYFAPGILNTDHIKMREIITKHFPRDWVIPYHMGISADLTEAWQPYKAASSVLLDTLKQEHIVREAKIYGSSVEKLNRITEQYLSEGTLSENYILDNSSQLLNHLRDCNVTIRWLLLPIYVPMTASWYDRNSKDEVFSLRSFNLLIDAIGSHGVTGLSRLYGFMSVRALQSFMSGLGQLNKQDARAVASLNDTSKQLEPLTRVVATSQRPLRFYAGAVSAASKAIALVGEVVTSLGHLQILRRQLARELSVQARLEATSLNDVRHTLDASTMTAVRRHYQLMQASSQTDVLHPYPGNDDHALLFELAEFAEASGAADPLAKILTQTVPLPLLPFLIFLYVLSQMQRLTFDPVSGSLLGKGRNSPDGSAIIVGVMTLLRQFHSETTLIFLAYVGQYIRTVFNLVANATPEEQSFGSCPPEVPLLMEFTRQFAQWASISDKTFRTYIPDHVAHCEYFSGEKALTRVEKNANLQEWFLGLARQIELMDPSNATASGRFIDQLIKAIDQVLELHQLDTDLTARAFMIETKHAIVQMMRTINIRSDILTTIEVVADVSYIWGAIAFRFVPIFQDLTKRAPSTVIKLRALFLKLVSILSKPLAHIEETKSSDIVSVSEYYSGELVEYARKVLQVIPREMFTLLRQIVELQTTQLRDVPVRLDKDILREAAQLDERYRLAGLTHSVAVFTEGMLAMERTLVGVIEVDPSELLEEGIRRELVDQVTRAMNQALVFPAPGHSSRKLDTFDRTMLNLRVHLNGFQRSFEYIQDYLNIYAFRIWQEELFRIIHYYVERECNTFLRKQISSWDSIYQSREIPIPHPDSTLPGPDGARAV